MRTLVAGAALVLALVVAAAALAASSAGRDRVTGAGWVVFPDFPTVGETTLERFSIVAHRDAEGDVHGHIVQDSPFGDVKAEVTCLVVEGDTAYVGGRIVRGFEYLGLPVSHISLGIRDAGPEQSSPDLVAGAIFRTRPADFDPCTPLLPFPPVFVVERGNFVVFDAAD